MKGTVPKGLVLILLGSSILSGAPPSKSYYMMPINCAELLPDNAPFTGFFEAVARGAVNQDRTFARRLFKILALKKKLLESNSWLKSNPVDVLIRKTICFYREQKEPIQPISFDHPGFVLFLKQSVTELEKKVNEAIYQVELEKEQRQAYERLMSVNRNIISKVEKEAENAATLTYQSVRKDAKVEARKK